METTTVIPANTPVPAAVAAPAAVAQSTTPAQAIVTPTIDTTPNVAVSDTNPLSPANIQKRIDEFNKLKGAQPAANAAATPAPASGEPAAAGTPAVADAAAAPGANTDAAATAANADAATTTDAAAPAADAAAASGEPAAELIVDLPPRNANGNPLKIAAPDAATADALRRLNNGYMRGEEARAKLAEADAQLARVREVEIMLQADPLGLVERIPTQQRVDVARTMLAEHFEELRPTIEKWWNDDSERRLARADSLEKRADARSSYESSRVVAQQVRAVSDAVRTLIPDTADTADAQEFYQDAVTHLANIARGRESGLVAAQEVPQLLERRLARFGFGKPAAGATTTTAPATSSNAAPAAAPAPAAQSVAAPAASVPTPNVTRVHAVNQARAAAQATTTVGAGATPVTTTAKPPKGLTIEQAADWAIAQSKARAQ